jgi:hypothetical protein
MENEAAKRATRRDFLARKAGQFHALLKRGFERRKQQQNDFEYAAVCDVWEPRFKHAQEATKAGKTYRDFREVPARPEIDGVVLNIDLAPTVLDSAGIPPPGQMQGRSWKPALEGRDLGGFR